MVKKFIKRGYLFLVLAFMYAPILLLVFYSFTNSTEIGMKVTGMSLELYGMLFGNSKLLIAVWNSLLLAFLSAMCSTLLGTMGAIGMFYSKKRTMRILSFTTQIPVVNAEIVTAIAIALTCTLFLFGRTYAALLIGHVVLCFPFVTLSVLPKLKQMDGNLYEAALDLGASPTKALFKIVLPEILPGIFSGFLLSVTLSLDDYIITSFTKPAEFDTISTYAFNAYAKGGRNSSVPALRALSALVFFAMLIGVIIYNSVATSKAKKQSLLHQTKAK